MSSDKPAFSPSQAEAPTISDEAAAHRSRALVKIAAALFAGMLACLFVQAFHPVFWSTEGVDDVGFLPVAVQQRLDRNNTMLVLALLGGVTGVALAIGQGAGRGAWKTVLIAAAKCGVAAALIGVVAGFVGHRTFEYCKTLPDVSDLSKAIVHNSAMLATLGGGIGLATGIFLGRSTRAALEGLVRGLLAGFLTSLIYLLVVAALMPAAMTTVLLPLEIIERLLWFGLFTGLLGALVVLPTPAQRGALPPAS
jgi:hypothetical protein